MAIWTGAGKTGISELAPENATATELCRLEPIISPDLLKARHLFGIPLVSRMKDPITGKHSVMTDDIIKDIIIGAVSQCEHDLHIDISPVERKWKAPFDACDYKAFGYMKIPFRPMSRLLKLSITPANNWDVWNCPLEWVETAYAHRGQLSIIPMTAGIAGGMSGGQVPASVFFLALMGGRNWVPAYFQLEGVFGYPDSMVPRIINELLGAVAAWEILSQLLATYVLFNSHSLSIDGMSQSISAQPRLWELRLTELEAKREVLTRRIKTLFGTGFFSGQV